MNNAFETLEINPKKCCNWGLDKNYFVLLKRSSQVLGKKEGFVIWGMQINIGSGVRSQNKMFFILSDFLQTKTEQFGLSIKFQLFYWPTTSEWHHHFSQAYLIIQVMAGTLGSSCSNLMQIFFFFLVLVKNHQQWPHLATLNGSQQHVGGLHECWRPSRESRKRCSAWVISVNL